MFLEGVIMLKRNWTSLVFFTCVSLVTIMLVLWETTYAPKHVAPRMTAGKISPPVEQEPSELVQSKEGAFPRAILPIVIFEVRDGVRTADAQGSGFVVLSNKTRLIATAFHVPEFIQGKEGYSVHALINGETCELQLFWKHKTADVALLRPLCTEHVLFEVDPIVLERHLPAVGSPVVLRGYKDSKRVAEGVRCEDVDVPICPHEAPLVVKMVDESMEKISIGSAIKQLKQYYSALEKNPKLDYEDMFYTKLLVAELPGGGISMAQFDGLSGGALLNADGKAVGIFTSSNIGRFVFVPVRELPSGAERKKYKK